MTHDTPLPAPQQDEAICDLAALEALMADLGVTTVIELVSLFVAETRARLHRIADCTDTGAQLLREVHTLKGGAGTVAATRLRALAGALELRLRAGGTANPTDIAELQAALEAYIDATQTLIGQATARLS